MSSPDESLPNRDGPAIFSARQRKGPYLTILVVFGAILLFVAHLQVHTVMESLIALGWDPLEVVRATVIELMALAILFGVDVVFIRQALLPEGELSLSGNSLVLKSAGRLDKSFRSSGSAKEAASAARNLCSDFQTHLPASPVWLARVFESCIAADRLDEVRDRLIPAARALPGLRQELMRFTRREFPERLEEMEQAIAAGS